MNFAAQSIAWICPMILMACIMTGCFLQHENNKISSIQSSRITSAALKRSTLVGKKIFPGISSSFFFRLFKKKTLSPKAMAIKTIGVIRTLSQDRTYVIVELEFGALIASGSELLVTESGNELSRLKVGDVYPPYFAADIISGNPLVGDLVKQ